MSEANDIDLRATVDIDLDFEVNIDGQVINKITMRRPKVRDSFKAKRVKGDDMDRGIALMADLCEQPEEVLMELDEIDLEKLQAQYGRFTGRTMTSGS